MTQPVKKVAKKKVAKKRVARQGNIGMQRVASTAHDRIDEIERDLVAIKTEMKLQFKEIFNRIKRFEAILITSSGAIILLLLKLLADKT